MCNCVRLHDKTIKIIKKNGPPYTEEGVGGGRKDMKEILELTTLAAGEGKLTQRG